jgi:DNA-binding Lrp family transcriptional regulator
VDQVDREIILNLLRDGRISQNRLAKILGLSAPSINARFNKLLEDKIIKGFKLLVNPNLYNNYFAYVAFSNLRDFESRWVFVKFKCLENFNVYGIEGRTMKELEDRIETMSRFLGKPLMFYFPEQRPLEMKSWLIALLNILSENPRASVGEIGIRMKYKPMKVKKALSSLIGHIQVIPIVDLIKADALLLAIFTKKVDEVKKFTQDCSIITVKGGEKGVEICFTNGIEHSKRVIEIARKIDEELQVMLVYDYEIRGFKSLS